MLRPEAHNSRRSRAIRCNLRIYSRRAALVIYRIEDVSSLIQQKSTVSVRLSRDGPLCR